MSQLVSPLNFKNWIEENRHLLKPPVCNKVVWENTDFIAMVVGGPNNRKDYHYNETPEFFYQVEGNMILKIIDEGKFVDVQINEGDIYYLPPKIPHSPQRFENTVGLVIEQKRLEGMRDALAWYCETCGHKLFSEFFELANIEKDLPIIFDKFYSNKENCTCNNCGSYMEKP